MILNASGPHEIVIGHTAYLQLGRDAQGVMNWGRGPLTHLADSYYGPTRARQLLTLLLGDHSVVRRGDNFVVRQVVPANFISTGNPGQVLITYTVYVADDYVTAVSPLLRGWVSIPVAHSAQGVVWSRVDEYRAPESTYGNYAHVEPIGAPPASATVTLRLCGPSYLVVLQGKSVCSVVGQ